MDIRNVTPFSPITSVARSHFGTEVSLASYGSPEVEVISVDKTCELLFIQKIVCSNQENKVCKLIPCETSDFKVLHFAHTISLSEKFSALM